ncbi:MAG TPA: M48 family metallopeptidase [Candidatus Sulfotelmatobacter sp.]|nr:M48 family metallopeptidase [Candidatus Sulfotelmatobacter sp.]
MKKQAALAVLVFILSSFSLYAASGTAQQPSNTAATQTTSTAPPEQVSREVTGYSLPPDLYKKAHDRSLINFRLALIGFVYGLIVLWAILHWKFAAKYRDWAERASGTRFLQALIFSPLLVITIAVLTLPLDIYSETIEKRFGISVQGWGSWSWDWIKGLLISLIIYTLLIWILYIVIRRSPRRWWFYFWLVSLPIGIFLFFIGPWVIDPMFHKFEPLQQKDPALTVALEQMVNRAGVNIPPERMFWMGAAEKTTGLNAYVTGIGASKRIVVWDTTIAKMNTPQIVFVAGHETGHYVLQHVPKGLAFFAVLLLVLFYVGYRLVGWVLARWGTGWHIRGLDDWASLPVLLLLLSVFLFLTNPIASGFSRYLEHQADQFGLEVTHGLTPHSGQIAAQAFQILGEVDLADPDPNPVNVFLFYSHPTIPERIQFSLTYDPWAHGGSGEFVK